MQFRFKLPASWDNGKLEDVATVQTGLAKGKKNITDTVRLPYLRVANVQDGYLDLTEIKEIEVPVKDIPRYSLQAGDLLLTEGGDYDKLGRGHIWKGELEQCLHQNHVFVVRPNEEVLLPEFLNYYTSSFHGKLYFLSCAKQTTNLASINSTQLKAMPIPLPPLPEQKKIAEILSCWDSAIEKIEKLIDAKMRFKKGLMQKILSDQHPNFKSNGLRKEIQLGEIATFHKGKGLSKKELDSTGIYDCIHYGELFTTYGEVISSTLSKTSTEGNHFFSEDNDVLMPTSDVTPRGLATASCIKQANVVLGGDILIIRTPKKIVNGIYLSYLIRFSKSTIMRLVTGTTVYHLYGSDMKSFKINLPSIEEQQFIVDILLTCDVEIHQFKYLRKQLALQKKALMQQLLTGKTRVKLGPPHQAQKEETVNA